MLLTLEYLLHMITNLLFINCHNDDNIKKADG